MHRPFKYLLSTTPSFSFLCRNTTTTTTISKHLSSLLLLLLQNNVVVGVTLYHLSVRTTRISVWNSRKNPTSLAFLVFTSIVKLTDQSTYPNSDWLNGSSMPSTLQTYPRSWPLPNHHVSLLLILTVSHRTEHSAMHLWLACLATYKPTVDLTWPDLKCISVCKIHSFSKAIPWSCPTTNRPVLESYIWQRTNLSSDVPTISVYYRYLCWCWFRWRMVLWRSQRSHLCQKPYWLCYWSNGMSHPMAK